MAPLFPLPPLVQTGSEAGDKEVRNQLRVRQWEQAQVRPLFGRPPQRFLVIDWTCLMHWDQLSGHRCVSPTPQMKQMKMFTLRAEAGFDAIVLDAEINSFKS